MPSLPDEWTIGVFPETTDEREGAVDAATQEDESYHRESSSERHTQPMNGVLGTTAGRDGGVDGHGVVIGATGAGREREVPFSHARRGLNGQSRWPPPA